jgi:predicted acylesterase/phospholipase RssA
MARRPSQTVYVFQGGGALGAYQAGFVEALESAELPPDWLVGTSIGAINAARRWPSWASTTPRRWLRRCASWSTSSASPRQKRG